jgi:hypothetical protein
MFLAERVRTSHPEGYIGVVVVLGGSVFLISLVGLISGVISIIRKEKLSLLGWIGALGCLYLIIMVLFSGSRV